MRPTKVRVVFDGEALYVGARMYDDSAAIADQLVRRDGRGAFDYVRVEMDPNEDNLTGYLFQVSAAGAERDAFLHDDSRVDEAFDAVWSSAVQTDSLGWTAEIRVPLSQIDFEAADTVQVWGVNFVRRRLASNSTSMFALRSRTESGRVSQFGRLTGIRIPGGGGALELTPYAAARARRAPSSPTNPFYDGSSLDPRVGLDASWSFRSNFTLDATLNPDFGQVEVDPAVVNLTAFETFFPEKRPFFTQDARLFDFSLSGDRRTLFFSRRIGREPRGRAPPGADFTDVPRATSIPGAAKVTGRTGGGLSVGALGAVTAREEGRAYFGETGRVEHFLAQPRNEYGVLRLQQDLRQGATQLGVIATGMKRELPTGDRFDHLPSTAFTGGVDFRHQWGGPRNRRYNLHGFFAASHVRGSPEAMVAIQTNPNHYFQRPDAGYLSVDSSATHLTGREWRLQLERQSARHWTWAVWLAEVSPEFSVDDMGFAGRTLPRLDGGARVRYQDISPGPLFRSWNVSVFTFHNFRHPLLDAPFDPSQWAGTHQRGGFFLNGGAELHNNWRLNFSSFYAPVDQTELETRGGPLMTDLGSYRTQLRVKTDRRSDVNLALEAGLRDWFGGGERLTTDLQVEVRPSSSWELRFGPRFQHHDDRAQYVTASDAVPYPPTYGQRYLFAEVRRRELSVVTRLNAAFTPNLSLQLFAQPLLSSGDFTAYKQLARPRSFEFIEFPEGGARTDLPGGSEPAVRCEGGRTCDVGGTRYVDLDGDGRSDESFPVQDFSLRSLRGNAVLRWEYSSGSELFVVWQQDRRGRTSAGRFGLSDDLSGLLDTPPENVFIVKVRHHLTL